jgi:hypothetical protein
MANMNARSEYLLKKKPSAADFNRGPTSGLAQCKKGEATQRSRIIEIQTSNIISLL